MENKSVMEALEDIIVRYKNREELTEENLIQLLDELYSAGLIEEKYYREEISKFHKLNQEKIEFLGLSKRAYNCLKRVGVSNYSELRYVLFYDRNSSNRSVPVRSFLDIRNMGMVSALEIIEVALKHHIISYSELKKHCEESRHTEKWKAIMVAVEPETVEST